MLKALVVDDEKLARDRIARFLGDAYQVEMAKNGVEALQKIKESAPDILFLDIQMPGLNGLEVLQQLEARPFKIIFQTAYDEFAIRAFDENACDYLLKPFSEQRFRVALERASNDIERLRNLERQIGYLNNLTVKQGNQLRIIPVSEVVCFVSRDHCTCLHTETAEFIVDLSLSHLEERLDPKLFKRAHRNSLIRIGSVTKLTPSELELTNKMRLPVSRRQSREWKETLLAD